MIKTIKELRNLIASKPIVEIVKSRCFRDLEADLDVGMRGRLIGIKDDSNSDEFNGIVEFEFNVAGFEPYNQEFAKANYYDQHNQPSLTWFESGNYPKNGKTSICSETRLYEANPFLSLVLGETTELLTEYLAATTKLPDLGYTQYLEKALLQARQQHQQMRDMF